MESQSQCYVPIEVAPLTVAINPPQRHRLQGHSMLVVPLVASRNPLAAEIPEMRSGEMRSE